MRLNITITAPFDVGDLTAKIRLEDNSEKFAVLRDGRLQMDVPSDALHLTLTTDMPPENEEPLRLPDPSRACAAEGATVDLHDLFERGCAIPPDGKLTLQLRWGGPCHSDKHEDAPEGTRFASWEHQVCAQYIGLAECADTASPLTIRGREATFRAKTSFPLGEKMLTFGEIICLAGDFYAHFDHAAAKEYEWAWPPLQGVQAWLGGDYREITLEQDGADDVAQLLAIIKRDADTNRGAAGEFAVGAFDAAINNFPARRYAALASMNYCHFASPTPGFSADKNEALRLYLAYHKRALTEASLKAANAERVLLRALTIDAFGCHFLSDLFASGHIRVPRRLLGEKYGTIKGALYMSKAMHEEDNVRGLWCTCRETTAQGDRIVWMAYGDGVLRSPLAAQHLLQVQEAVRRSSARIFAAHCGESLDLVPSPLDLLPIPLPPGQKPRATDILPDKKSPPSNAKANHWLLYWFLHDGAVVKRSSDPEKNLYIRQDEWFPKAFQLSEVGP